MGIVMKEKQQPALESIVGIPKRDNFPPVVSDQIDDFYGLVDPQKIESFRQQEIEELARKIREMPALPFREAREREMLRLTAYYEAFATLFGIDLREVARTRTQINATVMYTSPILLQAMFNDKGQEDIQGRTFFESRIQAGGFSFNATSINVIEGYPMSFSVLKRKLGDSHGEYEIDYPAVSLPREVFRHLKGWHDEAFPDRPLKENPILSYIADAFSYRIHDWIHQAILYDTNSATRIFQKWSDDSFFVSHFFPDQSMINYEFMSDKIHYLVWQQLFGEHPETKEAILVQAALFLEQLDVFEQWLDSRDGTEKRLANFLGYVGLRGLFNIIPISKLATALEHNPRFVIIQTLLPEKYAGYLTKLYEPIDQLAIPFRRGKNTHLSLQQILEEYVNGLREEFQTQRLISISGELWNLGVKNKLPLLLKSLPGSIVQQIDKNMDIRHLDPRILLMLNNLFEEINRQFGKDVLKHIVQRVEIDADGYFYLMIDQNEIDISSSGSFVSIPYQKEAILIQLPWDYGESLIVTLTRSQNVIATQTGASVQIKPGEIFLINIENRQLAQKLLHASGSLQVKGGFDRFWETLNSERTRGHIALGDMYPYDWDKARDVFMIESENISFDPENRSILRAGHYKTRPARRRAAELSGPVSINTEKETTRRRVLFGCIVENHVQNSSLDLFPVDALSFDRFYQAERASLAPFGTSLIFAKKMGIKSLHASDQVVQMIFKSLGLINDVRIHGFRGKPSDLRIHSLLS